jgi:drug/metabolite transporter (DMT)-like permease
MIVCIAGLSLGSSNENPKLATDGTSSGFNAFMAILLAILAPVSFSTGGLATRYVNEKTGFSPLELSAWSYIGANIILIIGLVFTYEYGDHPFILSEYIVIVISGFIAAIGVVTMNFGLSMGLAGPVYALANIQVIIQTVLDVIFLGQIPNLIQIISAIIGVIAAVTIAVGEETFTYLKNLMSKNKTE